MANQDISAWNECFRAPVQEIIEQSTSASYTTKGGIDLAKTSDNESWEPSDHIQELLPNAKDIKVELITKNTDLNLVNRELSRYRNVGLVLMGPIITRDTKPSLIALATKDKIFAIDPNDTKRGIQFLKRKLNDPKIHFWTTNGLHENDCLYSNYDIDLSDLENVSCCTGSHVHLMKSFNVKPLAALWFYPKMAIEDQKLYKRSTTIKLESFENLVEIWLDINKSDIYYDLAQLPHLNTRPLSLTAINIVKKRCILVLPLANTLESYNWKEVSVMSQNTYDRLTECNELVRKALLRKPKKKDDDFEYSFFAHLDSGFS